MNQTELTDFGTRYAAAWSSQHPVSLASFYSENGSLTVNGSAPSVGRTAIRDGSWIHDRVPRYGCEDGPSQPGRQPCNISLDVDRHEHRPTRHWEVFSKLAATRSGRLMPMASLQSRRVTSTRRRYDASRRQPRRRPVDTAHRGFLARPRPRLMRRLRASAELTRSMCVPTAERRSYRLHRGSRCTIGSILHVDRRNVESREV